MNYLELLRLAAPEAVVVLTALLLLTIALVMGRKASGPSIGTTGRGLAGGRPSSALASGIATVVAACGLIVAAGAVVRLPPSATLFGGMLVISPLNSLFKVVVLVLAFFTILLARGGRRLPNESEFLALLLLASVGLMLLIGSEELLTIFIGLELTGLSLYLLTAFDKTSRASAEAGLKYFLFGSMASAFTLFGLSLVYGVSGTTLLGAIGAKLGTGPLPPLFLVGLVMTLVGFAFKIAAAPFHLWAPDAYQGGPVASAAFIASASKVASFVVLGKIVFLGFGTEAGSAAWHGLVAGWKPLLALLAALSILLGNLAALAQKNVRRLLAYSAVAHGGYSLLGLVAGGRAGFSATLFYTTVYALTLLGAFGVVGLVRQMNGGDDLTHFAGLRQQSPLLAGCMAIFILSLAGLPPLAGFFGKFYLFATAMGAAADHGLLWLVALALFGSLISLYYYLIVLKVIFLGEAPATSRSGVPAAAKDFLPRIVISALAASVLLIGIGPSIVLDPILAALR
jgi:NADH-quinone oxidoreductase subunit N